MPLDANTRALAVAVLLSEHFAKYNAPISDDTLVKAVTTIDRVEALVLGIYEPAAPAPAPAPLNTSDSISLTQPPPNAPGGAVPLAGGLNVGHSPSVPVANTTPAGHAPMLPTPSNPGPPPTAHVPPAPLEPASALSLGLPKTKPPQTTVG